MPGVLTVENVSLVCIQAQFITGSFSVTGGDVSLISAYEPIVYVSKFVGGVCSVPSTNSTKVAGVPSASTG